MAKNKFLGLAMGITAILSSTNVYAASSNIVSGTVNDKLHQNVTVTGNIKSSTGTAPEGRLEVILPTEMTFTVDQDGNFEGVNYQVTNNSAVPITVGVSEFRETNNSKDSGIILQNKDENMNSLSRANVKMALVGDNNRYVDLGDKTSLSKSKDILDVNPSGGTGTIQLLGDAGKSKDNSDVADLNTTGSTENFTLVFEVKKKAE